MRSGSGYAGLVSEAEAGEAACVRAFARAFPDGAPADETRAWFDRWYRRAGKNRTRGWRFGARAMGNHLANVA